MSNNENPNVGGSYSPAGSMVSGRKLVISVVSFVLLGILIYQMLIPKLRAQKLEQAERDRLAYPSTR